MISEESRAFGVECDEAYRQLEDCRLIAAAPSLAAWFPKLRIWHYPAFQVHTSWSIFTRRRPSDTGIRYLVRVARWDRADDARRSHDPLYGLSERLRPSPGISWSDYPLDSTQVETRLAALAAISLEPFAQRPVGLDGETRGITLVDDRVRLEWWCDGPRSWHHLTSWATDMIRYLEFAEAQSQRSAE